MSRKHRLILVARTFWPHLDDSARRVALLAQTLSQHGIDVAVVTPRWENSEPPQSRLGQVKIYRLIPGPRNAWTESNFAKNVGRWIAKHGKEFQSVYCDLPNSVSTQLIIAAKQIGLNTIARFSMHDVQTYLQHAGRGGLGTVAAFCRKFDHVLVPDAESARQLHIAGVSEPSVIRVPEIIDANLIASRLNDSVKHQRQASLKDLYRHSVDFFLSQDDKLVLFLGRFDPASGFPFIAKAIGQLIDEDYPVVCWASGAWSRIRQMHGYLKDQCWHRRIFLHGNFDVLTDLINAADAVILPRPEQSAGYLLPHLMAANVPIVVSNKLNREHVLVRHDYSGLYAEADIHSCVSSLRDCLSDPEARSKELRSLNQSIDKSDHPASSQGSIEPLLALLQ